MHLVGGLEACVLPRSTQGFGQAAQFAARRVDRPAFVVHHDQRTVRQDLPVFEGDGHRRLRFGCASWRKGMTGSAVVLPGSEDPDRRQLSCQCEAKARGVGVS